MRRNPKKTKKNSKKYKTNKKENNQKQNTPKSPIKIGYFPLRGRAQVPRLLL